MKIRKTYLRVVSAVLLFKASAMASAPAGPIALPWRLMRKCDTKVIDNLAQHLLG